MRLLTASTTNFAWTYRADGAPSMISRPGGNHTELTYDALGRLTGSDTDTSPTTGGTDRAVYGWTHNRAGQVLSEASTISGDASNGTVTYAYDPLDRLRLVDYPSGTDWSCPGFVDG